MPIAQQIAAATDLMAGDKEGTAGMPGAARRTADAGKAIACTSTAKGACLFFLTEV